jgi:acetyl/propionyl-CoA carboxylase alpha subunit
MPRVAIRAPGPGRVSSVVGVGDLVSVGDTVAVVTAMKMECPVVLTAPSSSASFRVASHVRVGDVVEKGRAVDARPKGGRCCS